VFPPIVSVPTITSFHSILESHCTVASPAIVASVPTFNAPAALRSACVCTSPVAITFHPTVASPLVVIELAVISSSVASPACSVSLITAVSAVIEVVANIAFPETSPLAVTFTHSTSPSVVISSVAVIPFCTVKSPVIVTSHKYQANAEKSPLI
jgi:hypothetical protein